MVHIVEFYRTILLSGKLPDVSALLFLTIPTIVILLLGYHVFVRASSHFVDEL
jgi:lipopolysaccharide transport system permease protein